MMATISASEVSAHLTEILSRVAHGEEFTIVQQDQPVARLVPVDLQERLEREQAIDQLMKFSASRTLGPLKLKDLIAEGRL
jgi:prevent-host-death family protein